MRERVRELLEAGWSRQAIARDLGVDASTVTRQARILGFADVSPRNSPVDWAAVQAHYDDGHTIDECKARFGFSYGAWDKAATRGEIRTRPRAQRQLSHATRDRVEQLIARGFTQNQVAERLGLSKSTVAYHCRKLGRRADPRFARRYDWAEVQRAIDEEGLSRNACIRRFGFCAETWVRAVKRGDIVPRPQVTPLEELLVPGRPRHRGHIKRRIFDAGLKEDRCEICGINEWNGKPLSLELHHINGDGDDNRIENLMLLCGNCHAQTDNWGGRGARYRLPPDPIRRKHPC